MRGKTQKKGEEGRGRTPGGKILPPPPPRTSWMCRARLPGPSIYEEKSRLLPDKRRQTPPSLIQAQSSLSGCTRRKRYGVGALWDGIFPSKTRALCGTPSVFGKGLWA